jgi:hypothetical protein
MLMRWKTAEALLGQPSQSVLGIRDRVNLLLASLLVSLMVLIGMAIGIETVFQTDGGHIVSEYGLVIFIINTVAAYFYLRSPLRKIGFLECV